MVQVLFTFTALINIIILFNFVGSEVKNSTALQASLDLQISSFERFKETYGRVYPDQKSEQNGFKNFVINSAEVNKLNEEHPGVIAYQLNQYADLNPEEINEHFGIQMKPYDNMEHGDKETMQRQKDHRFIEDMHLYDLDEVDDLYEGWIKKWGKKANYTKFEKSAHFYRFVKTVVETNKKKFAGQDVSLGKDADIVRDPNQYFYG